MSLAQPFGLFFQELGIGILAMLPWLSPREIGWKFFRMQGGIAAACLAAGWLAAGGAAIAGRGFWGWIDSATAAALGGSVLVAMILGHWYLVVPKLSFSPLRLLTAVFVGALTARLAVVGFLAWQAASSPAARDPLWWALVSMRGLFGIATPLLLSYMIWECVKIRSNQSATGILYAAAVLVLIGEISSRFLGV